MEELTHDRPENNEIPPLKRTRAEAECVRVHSGIVLLRGYVDEDTQRTLAVSLKPDLITANLSA